MLGVFTRQRASKSMAFDLKEYWANVIFEIKR